MNAGMQLFQGIFVDTAALATVALVGYLFGRRTRYTAHAYDDVTLLIEIARAQGTAKELEHAAQRVRTEAGDHLRNVAAFQRQIELMHQGTSPASWPKLRDQADSLLAASRKLATTLSLACDDLRQHQVHLAYHAGARVDPETGLHNRRSMMEHLDALLSAHAGGERRLAAALISLPVPNDDESDMQRRRVQALARLLQQCVRSSDLIARYDHDDFIVVMPKTGANGAMALAERIIRLADAELECVVWGGVVEAAPAEPSDRLLSRADSALYSARANPFSCLYHHNGTSIRRQPLELGPAVPSSAQLTCATPS